MRSGRSTPRASATTASTTAGPTRRRPRSSSARRTRVSCRRGCTPSTRRAATARGPRSASRSSRARADAGRGRALPALASRPRPARRHPDRRRAGPRAALRDDRRLRGLDRATARLPAYVDGAIETMRQGVAEHIVQPRVVMERVPAQIAKQVVADPEQEPVLRPSARMPVVRPAARPRPLVRAGDRRHRRRRRSGLPPLPRLLLGRVSAGVLPARWVPGSSPWRRALRVPRPPAHDDEADPGADARRRLREVARIRGEMVALAARVGFKGTLPEFFGVAAHRPAVLLPGRRVALPRRTRRRRSASTRKLVTQFRTLPRTPYGVEPIPDAAAPDTTAAYYREPAADGSRAGTFFVNLYKPEARPSWEMMALALHESVPGHHLQIALASEQTGLPDFRRHDRGPRSSRAGACTPSRSARTWASTTTRTRSSASSPTRCGAPCGSSSTPACTRCTGVASRRSSTSSRTRRRPSSTWINEMDRYIAWPGQALAYKIGQLEILRLREQRAAPSSGRSFDVKAFHDVVLRDGAMPLDVLERAGRGVDRAHARLSGRRARHPLLRRAATPGRRSAARGARGWVAPAARAGGRRQPRRHA